jgi:hypothetical protein
MRVLIILTMMLFCQFSFGKGKATAPAAPAATAPAAPAAPAEAAAPAVETPAAPTEEAPAAPTEEAATVAPNAFKTGIFVSPGFTMFKRNVEEASSTPVPSPITGEVTVTELNVKGGYVFDFGLVAGAQVVYTKGKETGTDITTYSVGPTVGYSDQWTGLLLTATYHVLGKTTLSGGLGDYKKVTGLQVDLAYPMQLTENIKIGPELSWKRLKFSDHDTLGDSKTKEFVPSISAWFYF